MLLFLFITFSLLSSNFQNVFAFNHIISTPKPFANPSPNTPSSNVLELTKRNGSTRSSKALRTMQNGQGNFGSAPITSRLGGQEFSVSIQLGSQTFDVIMDTGSSDTWTVTSNFQCVSFYSGLPTEQSDCQFGPSLYNFDSGTSEIPNENFNISYGDGEFVSGCMVYDSVTLAGITVPKQEFAVANLAGWFGDNITNGLLGLAYPGITSAYAGDVPTADNLTANLPYSPLFTSMYQEQLVAPLFSIAISRETTDGPAGFLALGGTPPVEFNATFASTPIQILQAINPGGPPVNNFTFYAISPDAFIYGPGSTNTTDSKEKHRQTVRPTNPTPDGATQMIVDSGTTLLYLPTDMANEINNLYNPPATFSFYEGAYVVDCNATAPNLGIEIGGTVFNIDQRDMILDDGSGTSTCITGVNDAGFTGLSILGDVFMKNVVVVFDVGASELRFAARHY